MARVHPAAVVDPAAKLADDAEVGPYAVIGPGVELGPQVVVHPHAVLSGRTRIGARTRIHPFCTIGGAPQMEGVEADTGLTIGADNVIREYGSVHSGSREGGTRLGDGNFLLHAAHVAHDCRVGSHCIVGSQSVLAGHVELHDGAVLGAQVAVRQFCRVGVSAYLGAATKLRLDAPPFAKVMGVRPRYAGVNAVGLRRRGASEEVVATLRHAYHLLFRSRLRRGPATERVRRECAPCPELDAVLAFLEGSRRGVTH